MANRLSFYLTNERRWMELCSLLESHWSDLATEMELTSFTISQIDDKSKHNDILRSRQVIEKWIHKRSATLDNFLVILDKIDNYDAAQMIEKWKKEPQLNPSTENDNNNAAAPNPITESPQTLCTCNKVEVLGVYITSYSAITSQLTNVMFPISIVDTHKAYDTTHGTYTIPVDGFYQVTVTITYQEATWSNPNTADLAVTTPNETGKGFILRNTLLVPDGRHKFQHSLTGIFKSEKGQKVNIEASQTSQTASLQLDGNRGDVIYLNIVRIA